MNIILFGCVLWIIQCAEFLSVQMDSVVPLQRTRSSQQHYDYSTNSTFLPDRIPKDQHVKPAPKGAPRHYRTPIWDKYPLVLDLLATTAKGTGVSVQHFYYFHRHERFGIFRHVPQMSWLTLRDWKSHYSHEVNLAPLRAKWMKLSRLRQRDIYNVISHVPGKLKLGKAPILESFIYWKRHWKSEFNEDRSYIWLCTEMKRIVHSKVHQLILSPLFDPYAKLQEARVWKTLKFSWGFLNNVKVRNCALKKRVNL